MQNIWKFHFIHPYCALCTSNCRIVWVAKLELELASCCTVEKLSSPSISCPYVKYLSSSVRPLLYELKPENSNCVIKNMKREMKKSKQQLATKHFRWMYGCVLSALKLCTYEKRSVNIINEERRYYTSMAMSLDLFSVVSAQCARSSLEKSDDEKVFCDDEPNVNARCWSVNLT